MRTRLLSITVLMVCCATLASCAVHGSAPAGITDADRAEAYAEAVRHQRNQWRAHFVLDPVVLELWDRTRLASDPPDSIPHAPGILSGLLASGLFSGVCETRRPASTHQPVCPDSAPGIRVMFTASESASPDTLEFVAAYATIRRPGHIMRPFGVSCWYRMVRVRGVWTVAETRQHSIT